MKDEYDFAGAERGKFYRPGARLRLPLYLDDQGLKDLTERAAASSLTVSEYVEELLRRSA